MRGSPGAARVVNASTPYFQSMSTSDSGIQERFKSLLKALSISDIQSFARITKIPHQTVRSQFERRRFSAEVLSEISERGGSADWLLTGRGAMLRRDSSGMEADLVRVRRLRIKVAAGAGALVPTEEENGEWPFSKIYWTRVFGMNPQDAAFVEVLGDSMRPTLIPGQPVMVYLAKSQPKVDGIWVVRRGDTVAVKRVQFLDEGKLARLISDNPAYERVDLRLDEEQSDSELVGRVVWAPTSY